MPLSGLRVYETRFWKEGLEAGRTTIYLLASEKDAEHLPVKDGHSIQDIARRELRPGFKHRVLRCPGYMYPFTTDARRFELIAIFACLLFLFDGIFTRPSLVAPLRPSN